MDHPFNYVGCFVKPDVFRSVIGHIREDPLENDIQYPHVTFEYRPKEVSRSLFGENVKITIIGYGNDGSNEGLLVQLNACDPVIQHMIGQIEVPHITIAISRDGKSVNTGKLQFKEIDPIIMEGQYGGYTRWGEVIVGKRRSRDA